MNFAKHIQTNSSKSVFPVVLAYFTNNTGLIKKNSRFNKNMEEEIYYPDNTDCDHISCWDRDQSEQDVDGFID